MLKFSGFADLTSRLGAKTSSAEKKNHDARVRSNERNTQQTTTHASQTP